MVYLTLGSILKQEESYIEDFIKYHRAVGVERFVFLDREYYPLKELLKNYDDVEIIHYPDVPGNIHMEAWANIIRHTKGKTKWLACIDADQALVPVQTDDVREVLKDYEQFAALYVNWHTFGDSGHQTRLPGSLYERFLMRGKFDDVHNVHVQFICQPDRAAGRAASNPHLIVLNNGETVVNTNKIPIVISCVGLPTLPAYHNKLWIAHYMVKSREEWDIKNAKGRADIFKLKMDYSGYDIMNTTCNSEREERVLEIWQNIK